MFRRKKTGYSYYPLPFSDEKQFFDTHLGEPWSLAGEPWMIQWQTAAAGLDAPHRMIPRLSKTTSQCCCLVYNVWVVCWTSSHLCQFYPGHTRSAACREEKSNVRSMLHVYWIDRNETKSHVQHVTICLPQAPFRQRLLRGVGGWPHWTPSAGQETAPRYLEGNASWHKGGHTPSLCPVWRKCSSHWALTHAAQSLHMHCVQHKRCGPAHQWCHCPYGENRGFFKSQIIKSGLHSISTLGKSVLIWYIVTNKSSHRVVMSVF